MFGLPKGKVEGVSYSDTCPNLFMGERGQLVNTLGKHNFIGIQQKRSTSIPNLEVKPIIDIAIVVEKLKENQNLVQLLINATYTANGVHEDPMRHFIVTYKENKSFFHVNIDEISSKKSHIQIYFRNFLQFHQEMVQIYGFLKTQLIKEFSHESELYTDKKFIPVLKTKNSQKQSMRN